MKGLSFAFIIFCVAYSSDLSNLYIRRHSQLLQEVISNMCSDLFLCFDPALLIHAHACYIPFVIIFLRIYTDNLIHYILHITVIIIHA